MQYLFSESQNGFFTREDHGDKAPSDAIDISEEAHEKLIQAQIAGKIITSDADGMPIAVDPPKTTKAERNAGVEIMRLAAYRNEADPLFFKVQRGEAEHQDWLDKIAEIKARYPKEEA